MIWKKNKISIEEKKAELKGLKKRRRRSEYSRNLDKSIVREKERIKEAEKSKFARYVDARKEKVMKKKKGKKKRGRLKLEKIMGDDNPLFGGGGNSVFTESGGDSPFTGRGKKERRFWE